MELQSAALADIVAVVQKRIQQIRDRKEVIGEQNTKAALIDPILSALGWNLQEIDEVRREYRRKPQDNPVDYALLLNRTECLFIEAKALEIDLCDRKWISQNMGYAAVAGVQWCVLTNGDEYRIYNSHAPVDVEQKLFRTVRISDVANTDQLLATLRLLSKEKMRGSLLDELWKRHFVDHNVKTAIERTIREQDPAFLRVIVKLAHGVAMADVRASLKRARICVDFPEIVVADGPRGTGSRRGAATDSRPKVHNDVSLQDLIRVGLIRPPLTLIKEYKGKHLTAVVQPDGTVLYDGKSYDSLSTAGSMARKAALGLAPDEPPPATNGWDFWQYRDASSGDLRKPADLRALYTGNKQSQEHHA